MKIRKYALHEMERVAHLFDGWEETMIFSCLQGIMGSVHAPDTADPESACAQLNDFCFLAGKPDRALARIDWGRPLYLVPRNEAWAALIEDVFGDRAVRQIRYAIKKEVQFDTGKLKALAEKLPPEFEVRQIDRELYEQCLAEDWSRDLVAPFAPYAEFERLGLGFVVTHRGRVVAGASSYSRYREGIEIEIDTAPAYRRHGLATAAGATLILECLRRGWYPSWDAHNKASVALAEKLGYTFSHEYPVYLIGD